MRRSVDILVPIATPSVGKQSTGFGDEGFMEHIIASADAEYSVCLPYAGTDFEPYYGTFPVLFLEIFPVLFSVFYRDLFPESFPEKIPGIFRKRFPEKAREIPPGLFHGKPHPKIPKPMTESVDDGTDR